MILRFDESAKTLLFSFTASVILNTAFFTSADRLVTTRFFKEPKRMLQAQKLALSKKNPSMELEFVETPNEKASERPKNARKVSDKNSLAKDLEKIKALSLADAPKIAQSGGDQLAQERMSPSQSASPGSKPRPFSPPSPEPVPPSKPALPQESVKEMPKEAPKEEAKKAVPPGNTETPQAISKPQKPTIAAPAVQALPRPSGADRITTQAAARRPSGGAKLFGMTSFEATGSGMGVYMKNLKEKIWLSWFPYLAFNYPMDFRGADAVISITLTPKGDVRSVRIVESSGSPLFASYCVEAVQRISNFGDIPSEMLALLKKDEFEILFAFHYR